MSRRGQPLRVAVGLVGACTIVSTVLWLGLSRQGDFLRLTGAFPSLSRKPAQSELVRSFMRSPLRFEVNRGQADPGVRFLSRGPGYGLFLMDDEAVLALRRPSPGAARPDFEGVRPPSGRGAESSLLRLKLVGAHRAPQIEGVGELTGRSHYYKGRREGSWQTAVPSYAEVRYRGVYDGVDLVFHGSQGQLQYDFHLAPGADPGVIRLHFDGAERLAVDKGGNLIIRVAGQSLVQRAPFVYQQAPQGGRRAVPARYVVSGRDQVGFEVAAYDSKEALVIDPVIVYESFLGGSQAEMGVGIAVDFFGNAYVIGFTFSTNFPTTRRAHQVTYGGAGSTPPFPGEGGDAFVAKISPDGSTLVYSTYLGGAGDDVGIGIVVDPLGRAYVTGYTNSADFPVRGIPRPLQPAYGGGLLDAFVAMLDQNGRLVYSTYLGGGAMDWARSVALLADGSVVVVGQTESSNFPVVGGVVQPSRKGVSDGFVARLRAGGSALIFSTYVGGSDVEIARHVKEDILGNVFVCGDTWSDDLPVTAGALQSSRGGVRDAFVAKLNQAASGFVYLTYLGGASDDRCRGIDVDASGNAYVALHTWSDGLPAVGVPSPFQAVRNGSDDVYVAKINATGSALAYGTYLGGVGREIPRDIKVDGFGNAHVVGFHLSHDFPVTQGGTRNPVTDWDPFITKLNATGSALFYSIASGGVGAESPIGLALDRAGGAYVTGATSNPAGLSPKVFQPVYGGGTSDAWVWKIVP